MNAPRRGVYIQSNPQCSVLRSVRLRVQLLCVQDVDTRSGVCVRLESPFSPLPQPISKFSFDALPASRVPAGYCRRVSCSLSSCPRADSPAVSAPGQVDLRPRARRCVLTAADTGSVRDRKVYGDLLMVF